MDSVFISASAGLCFLIALANLFLWRDIKNPAVLHSFMWAAIVGLHTFAPHELFPLNAEMYLVISLAMILFSMGALLGFRVIGANFRSNSFARKSVLPNPRVLKFYFCIALIGLPLTIMKAFELASHMATDSFLINLRITLSDDENAKGFGAFSYFLPVAFSYFFLCLLNKEKPLNSIGIAFPFIVCLIYAGLSSGRTPFFLLILSTLFILSLTRPRFLTLGKVLFFLAMLLVVFSIIGFLLGKLGDDGSDALSAFWTYLLGGVSAFQKLLSINTSLEYGANTFRTPNALLKSLGFDVAVKKLVQEYVAIPASTNVYTVFQPYFLDFGIFFALFMQLIFGVIHIGLYRFARWNNPRAILLYSLSIYPLFMQWFQDQYASLMSMWIIYSILLLAPFIKPRAIHSRTHYSGRFGYRA